jgi:acyl carrier protein
MSGESSRVEIEETISAILCSALEVDPGEVVPGARIMDELGADSIDLLDIRFRIERALGIRITSDELSIAFGEARTAGDFIDMFTVEAMVDYLVARLEAANG